MVGFHDFLTRLESLDWRPAGYIDPTVLELLSEIGTDPQLIWEVIRSWDNQNLEKRQLRCHETSTHYKWFTHYHDKLQYRVWLHQYKSFAERKNGYAEVPHNHRYSLASVVLRGRFRHHFFENLDGVVAEVPEKCQEYSQGDVYSVNWRRVHKLSDLSDHTVTLVVESPVARHFSEAFYDESGRPSICRDFVELHSHLLDEIARC
jgi:hypothetical protein